MIFWMIFTMIMAAILIVKIQKNKEKNYRIRRGLPDDDQQPDNPIKTAADDFPSDLDEHCRECANYDNQSGICSTIHENIKSYPKKFHKKCSGQHFITR